MVGDGDGDGDVDGEGTTELDEVARGSAATSLSTRPSNYSNAKIALRQRGIDATVADLTHRFEEEGAARELLEDCLNLDIRRQRKTRSRSKEQGNLDGLLNEAVSKAMDATHKDEEHFSRALFHAVVRCFRKGGGGWRVHKNPSNKRRRVVQRVQPQEGPRKEVVYHFDDMILLGRDVETRKVSKNRGAAKEPPPTASSAAASAAAAAAAAAADTASDDEKAPPSRGEPATPPPAAADPAGGGGGGGDDNKKPSPMGGGPATAAAAAASPPRSPPGRRLRKRKRALEPCAAGATAKKPPPPVVSATAARIGPRTNRLVRRVGDTLYAMGLSRKVRMQNPKELSIINGELFPDHACIIYRKKVGTADGVGCGGGRDDGADVDEYDDADLECGEEWAMHRLLASVELKTDRTSGKLFDETQRKPGGDADEPEQGVGISRVDIHGNVKEHGPLAQELSYVVGHVLPGRVGLGLDLPLKVPFAVVAGKCSSEEKVPTDAIHWLHGNVVTPDVCGGGFYYTVDAFEGFNGKSGRHALAAYLDVMLSGLRAGEEWLANQNHLLLPPKPLSGRFVQFGSVKLDDFGLICSPLDRTEEDLKIPAVATRNARVPSRRQDPAMKASQGEIFEGSLNLDQLRSELRDDSFVTWCLDPLAKTSEPAEGSLALSHTTEFVQPNETSESTRAFQTTAISRPEDSKQSSDEAISESLSSDRSASQVLIKVVSRASYGQLVSMDGLLWRSDSRDFAHVKEFLAPSLHAVYTVFDEGETRGLVQLMPDLSAADFVPLRPTPLAKDRDRWRKMWLAFTQLVKGTLIPLAKAGLIHPDLRPGFNRTPNLSYNDAAGEMRIVDLDSLVSFRTWGQPTKDGRYLRKKPHDDLPGLKTALEYLFFQVIVISEAWLGRISEGSAVASDIAVKHEKTKEWRAGGGPPCDEPYIHQTLEDIGAKFGVPKNSDLMLQEGAAPSDVAQLLTDAAPS